MLSNSNIEQGNTVYNTRWDGKINDHERRDNTILDKKKDRRDKTNQKQTRKDKTKQNKGDRGDKIRQTRLDKTIKDKVKKGRVYFLFHPILIVIIISIVLYNTMYLDLLVLLLHTQTYKEIDIFI